MLAIAANISCAAYDWFCGQGSHTHTHTHTHTHKKLTGPKPVYVVHLILKLLFKYYIYYLIVLMLWLDSI